jgi:type 1 glutamine amidotransferase
VKTLVKWLAILCFVGWAGHNPGQVSADMGRVMTAGQSLISSGMNAAGSAFSGVTSGSGITPAAPTQPAAPAPTTAP